MATDPQMQQVLDQLAAMGAQRVETLDTQQARSGPTPAKAVMQLLQQRGLPTEEPVARVENASIPGPAGEIPVRVYTPSETTPLPVLVYFHGGGWVIADIDTYDSSCRALANAPGCIVVSVAYRQAPENPFPAAADDAYAAMQWVQANAASFGGDPARVAVAGESAGGNLAAVVCLLARDRREQMPICQLLVYPVTTNDMNSRSMQENVHTQPLDTPMMAWFLERYLKNPADGESPYVSPLKAQSLAGLPPATIILAELDPLRDEGRAYAQRLQEAGVPVTLKEYDGVTHEFFGMGAVVNKAKDAEQVAAQALRAAFGAVPLGMTANGTATAPAAPMGVDGASIQPGAEVVGSDGDKIGTVKEVRPSDILVDRRLKRDVYVPREAVTSDGTRVTVNVPADQVGDMGWPNP